MLHKQRTYKIFQRNMHMVILCFIFVLKIIFQFFLDSWELSYVFFRAPVFCTDAALGISYYPGVCEVIHNRPKLRLQCPNLVNYSYNVLFMHNTVSAGTWMFCLHDVHWQDFLSLLCTSCLWRAPGVREEIGKEEVTPGIIWSHCLPIPMMLWWEHSRGSHLIQPYTAWY